MPSRTSCKSGHPVTSPEDEPRCLLCDALFAEPPKPGRAVSRCVECARQVYSDSTIAAEEPLPLIARATADARPRVEIDNPETAATADPSSADKKTASNIPLHQPRPETPASPSIDDLPDARPVAEVGRSTEIARPAIPPLPTGLPAWAQRRPEPANVPTVRKASSPTLRTAPPPPVKTELIALPSNPDEERPAPQYGKALFVVFLLGFLALAAFLILGYTIVRGLKWKVKKAETTSSYNIQCDLASVRISASAEL